MSSLQHDERVAVARLHALLELLPTALDRHLAGHDLTAFEYTLLEALDEAEFGRLRLSVLASRTNATLPRLSRVATGLERRGLITRAACEEDGRATNAVLTDAGRRMVDAVRPTYEDGVRSLILGGLDPTGVAQLADTAYAILDRLDPSRRFAVIAGRPPADAPSDDASCPADPRLPAA
ncbi:MarR family winged helix-turn-helix transcriptional regulator [Microcella alkalica]|uniref:DNA-binding MarR family transcriptional regulator n=1 Tax=Microcella alkalica TaxID=355930 RepID=A0A839EC78_9MICO|nr:MarR family transcriptional regulator [Microcella alkalica]MBA8849087.1 DNA-binding MarR family transcriptional regulator [Microcella alkalica]